MARTRKLEPTRRVYLRLAEDAAELLDQLAPSENKRGEYVSALLRQAAVAAGLPITPPTVLDLAVLQQQLKVLQAAQESLEARVQAALLAQGHTLREEEGG